MGVACKKPRPAPLLTHVLLVLCCIGVPAWAAQCQRKSETSSPMFGSQWTDTFVLYTQDYHWKVSGDISKLNLYFGEAEGCVKGVKAQYGADPANAQRLGVEAKTLTSRSIQLKAAERIVRAEYKASSRCIEYLSFRTNHGRQLAVGKHDSPTPTIFATPSNPSGYLGYFNGHTAKPMSNPNVGKLMQLQLVWVSAVCDDVHTSVATAGTASAPKANQKAHGKAKNKNAAVKAAISAAKPGSAAAADSSSSSSGGGSSSDSNTAKCAGNHLCKDGKCSSSSCLLAGIGSEVPNMMCQGANMRLPFLSSGVDMSPCSFLGCKLDHESCTSSGMMGVGGYCTGRVVAMAAPAMLHPQGKQWLGYPCIEHRSASASFRASMLGEMTSSTEHIIKAWKVCDCVKRTPLRNSLAIMMPNGTITSYIFGDRNNVGVSSGSSKQQQQQPTVAVPLMPVYDMGIKDVVTQWLAAHAGNAGLPQAVISAQLAADLKQLVPGFMTPSIMIANTSAALLSQPDWMDEVPVFILPDSALNALKTLLPDLTSLPTLALTPDMSITEAATLLELPEKLVVSDITVEALPALAAKLGLPTFLKLNPSTSTSRPDQKPDAGPHLVPLNQMHIGNVVVQWATAVTRKSPLPRLVLAGKPQLERLQAKVPGLVTPSIIVPNISHPLLFKAQSQPLPLYVLPSELTAEVMAVFPDITSLPSFLLTAEQSKEELPDLHLADFIAPNMRVLVETLGPSIPLLLKQVSNMSMPALNLSMAGLAENPALQAVMSGPWAHMLTSLPELPDILVDATNFDMGSVKEVVAAVKDALATSGFKLPYLTMNDDTLQKWGVKKLEGFVTNVVTRATTTAREDPSLIDDADDDQDDDADEEEVQRHSSKKRKHRQSRYRTRKYVDDADDEDDAIEAKRTAQQHSKVAAALNVGTNEKKAAADGSAAPRKASSGDEAVKPGTIKQQVADKPAAPSKPTPNSQQGSDKAEKKLEQELKESQSEKEQEDPLVDENSEDYEEEEVEEVTSATAKAVQPPKKPAAQAQPTSQASASPAAPAVRDAEQAKPSQPDAKAAAGSSDGKGSKPDISSSGSHQKGTPAASRAAEPPLKPVATLKPPLKAAASPVPSDSPSTKGSAGKAVPTQPVPKASSPQPPAASVPAAQKPAPAPQQPPPAPKPLLPAGTEDEDGAVVIDEVIAKRAWMTEEQWAAVSPEHKSLLLKLLDLP